VEGACVLFVCGGVAITCACIHTLLMDYMCIFSLLLSVLMDYMYIFSLPLSVSVSVSLGVSCMCVCVCVCVCLIHVWLHVAGLDCYGFGRFVATAIRGGEGCTIYMYIHI